MQKKIKKKLSRYKNTENNTLILAINIYSNLYAF